MLQYPSESVRRRLLRATPFRARRLKLKQHAVRRLEILELPEQVTFALHLLSDQPDHEYFLPDPKKSLSLAGDVTTFVAYQRVY